MRSLALAAVFFCALTGLAYGQGQPLTVYVVPACGTGTSGYTPTQNRLATMDTTGKLCTSGSGGGGGGGGNVATRIVLSPATVDVSTTNDGAILWASTQPMFKSQSIYSCGAGMSGNVLIIKDEIGTAGAYSIVLTPVTGTIDGISTYTMNFNYQSASLVCNGAGNWSVM